MRFFQVTVVSIIISLLLCGCSRRDQILLSEYESTAEAASETTSYETEIETEQTANGTIYVHVCGAVTTPGVYELPEGSRYFEAVRAAGGFTQDADTDYINMAKQAEDGAKITVPTLEEGKALREKKEDLPSEMAGTASSSREAQTQVNLNTATLEQLCTLPGVGETRARSILAYRETHGDFSKIEDIMKVSGIKDGLFQQIKDRITV
ncbi:MAG: helix-hairpin-helix domain-containing protein [Lachnospiraceae bacterium]|nr:helix-hairpin-helix domain-containing protein [Lachnospiraceae bacterium]